MTAAKVILDIEMMMSAVIEYLWLQTNRLKWFLSSSRQFTENASAIIVIIDYLSMKLLSF